MQKATQQLTNTSKLTVARRDIARVRTLLTQKTEGRSMNEQTQQRQAPKRRLQRRPQG